MVSLGVICFTHSIDPLSNDIAIIESDVFVAGKLKLLPVPTYIVPLSTSMVGLDQIPAPDGPNLSVLFFVGVSDIVKVFQITEPSFAFRAERLPRKEQQG